MTASEQKPTRVAPYEWEHILPIVTAQRRDSDASGSATRAAAVVVSVSNGAVSVSRDSIDLRMDVYGSDGEHVGRVKDLGDAEFLVGRRWRADTRVPLDRVLAVIDRRVILTMSGHTSNGEM